MPYESNELQRQISLIPHFKKTEVVVTLAHNSLVKRGLIKTKLSLADSLVFQYDGFTDDLSKLLDEMSLEEIRDYIRQVIRSYPNQNELVSASPLIELTYRLLKLEEGQHNLLLPYPRPNLITNLLDLNRRYNAVQKSIICLDPSAEASVEALRIAEILGDDESLHENLGDIAHNRVREPFNRVLAFVPFGYRVFYMMLPDEKTKFYKDVLFMDIADSEWQFVDNILASAHNDFRCVIAVTGKTLYDKRSSKYRNALIKDGLIEGIIELPGKSMGGAFAFPIYLVVLSRGNSHVKFLDASNMVIQNKNRFAARERFTNLDLGLILESYDHDCEVKSIEETIQLKNLAPSVAVIKVQKYENGVALNEVAEVFSGNQYTIRNFEGMISELPTGCSILTSNDINDTHIDISNLTHINYEDTKLDKYAIQYGDLVVTSKSSKVKVGVVDFEVEEKIIVTGGMIIIRPDLNKLDPFYLKMYLDSPSGKEALKTIQKGGFIITINAKDLSSLEFPLEGIEKQHAIANAYKRKISSLLALQEQANAIKADLDNLFEDSLKESK